MSTSVLGQGYQESRSWPTQLERAEAEQQRPLRRGGVSLRIQDAEAGPRPALSAGWAFFTGIDRPVTNGEEAQAVAFLVPHTHQAGLSFWSFLATVAVVER